MNYVWLLYCCFCILQRLSGGEWPYMMSNKSVSSKATGSNAVGPADRKPAAVVGQKSRSNADRRLLQLLASGSSDKDDHTAGYASRDNDNTSLDYGGTGRRDHPQASISSHAQHVPHVVFENSYRLEPQVDLTTVHRVRRIKIETLSCKIIISIFNHRNDVKHVLNNNGHQNFLHCSRFTKPQFLNCLE